MLSNTRRDLAMMLRGRTFAPVHVECTQQGGLNPTTLTGLGATICGSTSSVLSGIPQTPSRAGTRALQPRAKSVAPPASNAMIPIYRAMFVARRTSDSAPSSRRAFSRPPAGNSNFMRDMVG